MYVSHVRNGDTLDLKNVVSCLHLGEHTFSMMKCRNCRSRRNKKSRRSKKSRRNRRISNLIEHHDAAAAPAPKVLPT
jgi:hypothetical protein